MVKGFVKEKTEMVLVAGESPKVVAENGGVKVVGQEYLPTLLALGKKVLVVGQIWVVVVLEVSDSQPEGCRGCL